MNACSVGCAVIKEKSWQDDNLTGKDPLGGWLSRRRPLCDATITMNVTITIDDELCGQARQHALAKGKSLSGWLAGLVRKAVGKALSSVATTLLDGDATFFL